ncbi:MAG: MltR family transcriptional regulator [Ignavibacteria bacterium]
MKKISDEKYLEIQIDLAKKILPFDKLPDFMKELFYEFAIFRNELAKESDRGCALLASSYIDYLLTRLLEKKLIGSKTHKKQLFLPNGPLGSFSSKILLCYSMGLIAKNTMNDINIIRKIRNEFGHSPKIISFENPKINLLCKEFIYTTRTTSSNREKYLSIISVIAAPIQKSIMFENPFTESDNSKIDKAVEYLRKFDHDLSTEISKELKKYE